MTANALFICELVIFNGVALAWAGWEWWSVRPGKAPEGEQPPVLADPAGHSEREHEPHDR